MISNVDIPLSFRKGGSGGGRQFLKGSDGDIGHRVLMNKQFPALIVLDVD